MSEENKEAVEATVQPTSSESINFKLTKSEGEPVKKKYNVVVEGGIFKNGKLYQKNETIELEQSTGDRFVAAGNVEEVKE